MKNIILVIIFVLFFSTEAFGQAENQAIEQAEVYNFNEIEEVIEKNAFENGVSFDFKQELENELKAGEGFNFKTLLENGVKVFFSELYSHSALMRNIIIICVLSGVFKSFTDSFKTKEISELGFYVCYIATVMLLLSSFNVGISLLRELVGFIGELSKASAPVLAAVMMGCGEISAGGIFSPIVIFTMSLLNDFVEGFFIPGIKIAAVISVVNYLSNKEMLERLSAFLSAGLAGLLKIGAFIFMGVISLQKISTGTTDNAVSKTLQAGINAVPVIGDVFSGATQSIIGWSMVLKTSVGISVVIGCVAISIVHIIKILIIMLLYKITAIVIEPFCDKRITSCIDTIGGYMLLILSAAVTVIIMFIFVIIIFISAIGG